MPNKRYFILKSAKLFFCINLLYFSLRFHFPLKILLCTIAKEENKYIKEFVEHYQKLKVNKIIIYDNNDIDSENFTDILKNEISNNFVKIINYRGFEQPQIKALNNCYEKNNKRYDWIAFYDVDEFLHIINYTDLNKFMSLPRFKKCQSILINWKYYGDNDLLYYEPKPLSERFTKPFYFNNSHENIKYKVSAAKTIVRGGLKIEWMHLPHYLKNTINCRPDGSILYNYFSPPQYSIAYLSHYTTKSTEEFAERLIRGDVFLNSSSEYIKNRIFQYYFLINSKTKEKIDLFRKKLKHKINFL